MAKHSQSLEVLRRNASLESFFKKHGPERKALGWGEDFSFNRELPASPPTAHYLRRNVSFWDAMKEVHAHRPARTKEQDPRAWEMLPFIRKAAETVLTALGERRDDLKAARAALHGWCDRAVQEAALGPGDAPSREHPSPAVRAAWTFQFWLEPLLTAYENPRRFFCEVAPQIDPNRLFDPVGLTQPAFSEYRLGGVLHTWGYGALLNPEVRAAFDQAAENPERFARVVGWAEGRGSYVEGRKPGQRDSKQRKPHVDNTGTKARVLKEADRFEERYLTGWGSVAHGVRVVAEQEGRTASAIRRRMSRASREK
jgi:hypothetical protein